MMRITLALFSVLLLQFGHTEDHLEQQPQQSKVPIKISKEDHLEHKAATSQPPSTASTKAAEVVSIQKLKPKVPISTLLSEECMSGKYTRSSCAKVFCPPWQRCINGLCVCKLPYQCPRLGARACGLDGRNFLSLCQAQAIACRDKKPVFSHYASLGNCDESFEVKLWKLNGEMDNNEMVVQLKAFQDSFLVCGSDSWNMAAANVACKNQDARGAQFYGTLKGTAGGRLLSNVRKCIDVRCTGAERTLAECDLYKPHHISDNTSIATVTCFTPDQGQQKCEEFRCVNEKCVSWDHICDGVDDCGDNSDEMCCTACQKGAFYCKSGVCLPRHTVGDEIRDCLGGEDEHVPSSNVPNIHLGTETTQPVAKPKKEFLSNPTADIKKARNHTETLQCGIPNYDYVHKTEEETRYRRTKRVVGGEEALPTQIQWQVAVQEDGKINCGGVYLGGCWVLTAAHCVRMKPQAFRIKFSLWRKQSPLSTTDSVPVKNIIIHHEYNARTYQNDIALIQLEELANVKECLNPNPAVRPVCVPWSTLQFPPHHTCTISGWGRNKEGQSVNILKWANVSLIPHCESYYKERFYDGMMCAGDLDGHVDSCQGDSGGPLVCKDTSGVSYVWGIVSWGDKCGEAGFPGVYTRVAHYFEWIRQQTGWPAVTMYNQ